MSSPESRSGPATSAGAIVRLLFALALSPAAWIGQLVATYGVASYACYPRYSPAEVSPPPGWGGEGGLLLIINLGCLAAALIGFLLAAGLVKAPRHTRTHFLALCGMFAGAGFAVAILFDTWPILGVPACWSIAT
jgi:hypothetical protein